ncbi:MAG: TlpA disulfide reductase family protein [Anaerolineales bacterium]
MLRFRILSLLLLILGLLWIGFSADRSLSSTAGHIPAPRKGFLAPDFTLETLEGQSIRLNDLRGRVVVLNFWATWCPPCRAEMPTLEKISREYQGQEVVILGINSTIQDDMNAIPGFVTQRGITFPILLDKSGKATRLYEIRALPTTFFIGPDGIIRFVTIGGPISEVTLRAQVEGSR